MKLCCKRCRPDCAFCINLVVGEKEDSCSVGQRFFAAAPGSYPCEYFECFMYEKEEKNRLEISKEEYLRDYEERYEGRD